MTEIRCVMRSFLAKPPASISLPVASLLVISINYFGERERDVHAPLPVKLLLLTAVLCGSRSAFCQFFGCHVFDVRGDAPVIAAGIFHAAAAITVKLILQRGD